MIDVDHFKQVNDRFGHARGDRVLAAVAAVLQAELPRDALLGRLGGEEFAMLLPGAGPAQAGAVAERLRRRVAALPLPDATEAGGPPPAGVTASFGSRPATPAGRRGWSGCWRGPTPRSTLPRRPGGTGRGSRGIRCGSRLRASA